MMLWYLEGRRGISIYGDIEVADMCPKGWVNWMESLKYVQYLSWGVALLKKKKKKITKIKMYKFPWDNFMELYRGI